MLTVIANACSRFKHQLCFKITPKIIKDLEFLHILSTYEFEYQWKYKNTLTDKLNRIIHNLN